MKNIHKKTLDSFSDEWLKFDQQSLNEIESHQILNNYFKIYPLKKLKKNYEIFDMGCGTGRWAYHLAPFVKKINCIDPSSALEIAKKKLKKYQNIVYHKSSVDNVSLKANSQDFGYSLGVLHHIPDTKQAIKDCYNLLKPGGYFLCYLYYSFDNKPKWFKFIWFISNFLRIIISKFPNYLKMLVTDLIALFIYYPFSKISLIVEKFKIDVSNLPLSYYRNCSFYTMRTDSRDRFGTPLEKRFTKYQIKIMMEDAGFIKIKFSNDEPFWCFVGYKPVN